MQIAEMIRHEGMDLVALMEVTDEDALTPVLTCLGPGWEKSWHLSRPKRGVSSADLDVVGEGYAFIWNKRRLARIQSTLLNGQKKDFEPVIYDRYNVHAQKGLKELVRDPLYGRFTPSGLGGGNFELRVICDHIRFNVFDNQKDRLMWGRRQNEFDVLTKVMYPRIEDMNYGSSMPAYTVLMGDFNLNLRRFWTGKPFIDTPQDGLIIGDKRILTVQDQLTTLKKPKDKNPQESTVGYQNNFDHFCYNANRLASMRPAYRRVDVMGTSYYTAYYGDYDRYREEISDHIPIVMTLTPS